MKKRKFAVFDIDGTIFRSSLLIETMHELIARGLFPRAAERVYAAAYRQWLDRKGSYDDYLDRVVVAFHRYIRGVPVAAYRRIAAEVVAFHKDRTYRYTRDLVKDLKRRGYFLIAISNSKREVVGAFARRLGFHAFYGRLLEVDRRGRFTGNSAVPEEEYDKELILRRAIREHNLDLRGSVGVGDTESDIAFLKHVARPICFNPNSTLYRIAKRRGWKVVVERKDVIYHL